MKTSNTIVLSDSGNLTPCEKHDLALALARAVPSETTAIENAQRVLMVARSEETWQRTRFVKFCDNTELPHHSVVGDWAKALAAVEAAEDDLAYIVGQIHFWWGTSVAPTA